MNPGCDHNLIKSGSFIGERAHIVPKAEDGDVSFENLILLCRICHRQVDDERENDPVRIVNNLRNWKGERNREIRQKFTRTYQSFEELRQAVTPLLERNGEIFSSYGPDSQTPGVHELWSKFEPELISNNSQIELMLNANTRLFPDRNKVVIGKFRKHVREFIHTRGTESSIRVNLFPVELLSIFGLAQDRHSEPMLYLPALQNFVSDLNAKGNFISLELEPEPKVVYRENDEVVQLHLDDVPRVTQVYWNGHYYHPISIELRPEGLIFFLKWLTRNGIKYRFKDIEDLSELILNEKYHVKLCYKYCLSVSDLNEIGSVEGLHIVNLHNWNSEPIENQARSYAKQFGMRVFEQNEFFSYAHKKIKE